LTIPNLCVNYDRLDVDAGMNSFSLEYCRQLNCCEIVFFFFQFRSSNVINYITAGLSNEYVEIQYEMPFTFLCFRGSENSYRGFLNCDIVILQTDNHRSEETLKTDPKYL
jgi:hypothetical protein